MCYWNEEGASCDTPEDTVETAHWLDQPSSATSAAVCADHTVTATAPIAAEERLAESTDQMLAALEAQAQRIFERKKHRQHQRKRQRQATSPTKAASVHAPMARPQPCTVVPHVMLPSDANDPAATTNFAALFAMRPDRPVPLPTLTPSVQRLYDVGVKPHIGTYMDHHRLQQSQFATF
eukprot:COSAG02_NODE_8624_length_2501_cov_100.993846_1_plen_179_part_10